MAIPDNIFETMAPEPYETVRDKLRSGDLLLFSGPAFMSKMIEWATGSPWSHVGFVLRLGEIDRVLVLEAVPVGARSVALSSLIQGNTSFKPFDGRLLIARHVNFPGEPGAPRLKAMSQFAVDRFGAPYANMELVGIGMRIFLGWFNIKLPPPKHSSKAFICSEYAARCYKEIGIEIAWNGKGFIAPADFADDPNVVPFAVIETHVNGKRQRKHKRR